MNAKIIIVFVALILLILPSAISSIELIGASCSRVDIGFPIYWHGYSCIETGGTHRGFVEPYAYETMVAYYTPELVQTAPDYTFVIGGSTEGLTVVP